MIEAFREGKIEKAEQLFREQQDSTKDPIEKLYNEAFYSFLRYEFVCDTSALPRLYELSKNEKITGYTNWLIGLCQEKASQFDKAAQAYKISAQLATVEGARAQHFVSVAKSLFKAGKQGEAFEELISELQSVSGMGAVATVYEGLASLYELAGDNELQALALEKALELKPNDTNLRFKTAYSYSKEKGFNALSLQHYQTLLEFESDNADALNNLAVQHENLKMPLTAVDYYKKSADLDETLAMANLALRLLNAGFEKEAREIISRAQEKGDVDPNVATAFSSISSRRAEEEKTTEASLKLARDIQNFQLSFAEAYFKKADCPNLAGKWKFADTVVEVEITQNGNEIEAAWNPFLIGARQFKGNLRNNAARIIVYKKEYDFIKQDYSKLTEEHRGKIYFSPDNGKLIILNQEKEKSSLKELTRVIDEPEPSLI